MTKELTSPSGQTYEIRDRKVNTYSSYEEMLDKIKKELEEEATELRCYKTLYLTDLVLKYEERLLCYSHSDLFDSIKKYLDICRKKITKIYNELFDIKIETYNIDWLDFHSVNQLSRLLFEFHEKYEVFCGIDARTLRDNEK
jgi:hypothetical protein